ncbi:hypothetical protein CANARDRAFT_7870 [[Candida] arabinofermentans NRRL YB-2248]|uniref:Uncharacterized protein n=1 Tax=[Candida] arabinofermentans NRRL YB-2248 TaxID=983967 RepID=A0A1E4T0G2_9ASCO|nr:hypothetical protein CANARDRAFT_7870 [[Candida] arabinofermentans NRRL YB-2248]
MSHETKATTSHQVRKNPSFDESRMINHPRRIPENLTSAQFEEAQNILERGLVVVQDGVSRSAKTSTDHIESPTSENPFLAISDQQADPTENQPLLQSRDETTSNDCDPAEPYWNMICRKLQVYLPTRLRDLVDGHRLTFSIVLVLTSFAITGAIFYYSNGDLKALWKFWYSILCYLGAIECIK